MDGFLVRIRFSYSDYNELFIFVWNVNVFNIIIGK